MTSSKIHQAFLLGSGVLIGVVGTVLAGYLLSDEPSVAGSATNISPDLLQAPPPGSFDNIEVAEDDRPVDENGNGAPLWSSEVTAAAAGSAEKPFAGEVHPSIAKTRPITLTAYWSELPPETMDMHEQIERQKYYKALKPVDKTRKIEAEILSAFLPKGEPVFDELWAVDLERVGRLLTQFHPSPEFRLHNGGPNGGYSLLRGESDTHWLVNSRIHAEFHLGEFNYYTPAYFEVDLLINRDSKKLEFFRLALPQRHGLNVDMNAGDDQVDIQRVERMELSSDERPDYSAMNWTRLLTEEKSWKELSLAFYAFQKINWLQIDEVATLAKQNTKPMNIMMMWGVLDDQSC